MQILASLTKTTQNIQKDAINLCVFFKISTYETSAVYMLCWSSFQVPQESVCENSNSFEWTFKNIF